MSNLLQKIHELYQNTDDNVTSVGYGYKYKNQHKTDQLSIVFGVKKKKILSELSSEEIIPDTITIDNLEYSTDIVEILSEVKALTCYVDEYNSSPEILKLQSFPSLLLPLKGGQEIAQFPTGGILIGSGWFPSVGTLGFICVDKDDNRVVGVTNAHVACGQLLENSNLDAQFEPYNIYTPIKWPADNQNYTPGCLVRGINKINEPEPEPDDDGGQGGTIPSTETSTAPRISYVFETPSICNLKKTIKFNTSESGNFVDVCILYFNNAISGLITNHSYQIHKPSYVSKLFVLNSSNGTIDSSFNSLDGFNDIINSIQVQTNNHIIVGGNFVEYNSTSCKHLVRLTPSGTIDNTFNTGSGFNESVNTVVLQNDGKILVGGNFNNYNSTVSHHIIRLNSDGTIDTSFNNGGHGFNKNVHSIAIDNDGKIWVGGEFNKYNHITSHKIIKLTSSGTIDTVFDPGFNDTVKNITISSTNDIIVTGNFTSYSGVSNTNSIVKLNSSGALDQIFSQNLRLVPDSQINTVSIANNRIVIGGNFRFYRTIPNSSNNFVTPGPINYIAGIRLSDSFNLSQGTLDNSFALDSNFDNDILSVRNISTNLLVGGKFTKYRGNKNFRFLMRFDANSTSIPISVETNFANGLYFDNYVNHIVSFNNKLLIGGQFTSYSTYSDIPYLSFATTSEINAAISGTTLYSTGRTTGPKGWGKDVSCQLELTRSNVSLPVNFGLRDTILFNDALEFKYKDDSNFPVAGGDSGSALIANISGVNKIIGLVFAGNAGNFSNPNPGQHYGYACRIDRIADEMNIKAWEPEYSLSNTTPSATIIQSGLDFANFNDSKIVIDDQNYWNAGLLNIVPSGGFIPPTPPPPGADVIPNNVDWSNIPARVITVQQITGISSNILLRVEYNSSFASLYYRVDNFGNINSTEDDDFEGSDTKYTFIGNNGTINVNNNQYLYFVLQDNPLNNETVIVKNTSNNNTILDTFTILSSTQGISVPSEPYNVFGSINLGNILVTWNSPIDNGGSFINDYLIQYSSDSGNNWTTFNDGISSLSSTLVTNLTVGNNYIFKVAAINVAGTGNFSSNSNSVFLPAPTVPGVPINVQGTPGNKRATINWQAPIDNGGKVISDYIIQYSGSDNPNNWITFIDSVSTNTSVQVTGLINDIDYQFRVAAVNIIGTGDYSFPSSIVTPISDNCDYTPLSINWQNIRFNTNGYVSNGSRQLIDGISCDTNFSVSFSGSSTSSPQQLFYRTSSSSGLSILDVAYPFDGYTRLLNNDTFIVSSGIYVYFLTACLDPDVCNSPNNVTVTVRNIDDDNVIIDSFDMISEETM
jgi:uncharacterized delta-60 repeat protein